MHPAFSSLILMPDSSRKPPSMPISPNSFSISTTCWPWKDSRISFLIRVVLPAPKKPEKNIDLGCHISNCLVFFSLYLCDNGSFPPQTSYIFIITNLSMARNSVLRNSL